MFPLAHYAMLVGICELIPLPFVDDWLQRRLLKRVVRLVLRKRGRIFPPEEVQALYIHERGLLARIGAGARALVLKPMKKLLRTVLIVFAARRAVLEAAEVLLLGHTLDRLLAAGWMRDDLPADQRRDQARRVARAVARAWGRVNRRALVDLIRASGAQLLGRGGRVQPPPASAVIAAGTEEELDVDRLEASLPPGQLARLREAAQNLAARLSSGEGQSWLAKFDAEVDRHL